jgi:pimeloyl-ACP methyl ester carboxylesterase
VRFKASFFAALFGACFVAPAFSSPWKSWFCNYNAPSDTLSISQNIQNPTQEDTLQNAAWPAWLAMLSYAKQASFAKLGRVGMQKITVVQNHSTGTLGFVGETATETLVVFEGSTTPKDFLIDFMFHAQPDPLNMIPGKVHNGFMRAANSVWSQVQTLVPRSKPITVIGHSLGGALAAITSLRLAKLGFPVTGVYTFEAPRVGDEEFAQYATVLLGDRFLRFENENDVVPHLPPRKEATEYALNLIPIPLRKVLQGSLKAGNFSHIGNAIVFSPRGELQPVEGDADVLDVEYYLGAKDRSAQAAGNIWNWTTLQWRMFADHLPFSTYCYLKQR